MNGRRVTESSAPMRQGGSTDRELHGLNHSIARDDSQRECRAWYRGTARLTYGANSNPLGTP